MEEHIGEIKLEGTYGELIDLLRMARQYGRVNPQYSGTTKAFARAVDCTHVNLEHEFSYDAGIITSFIRAGEAVPHSVVLWFLGHVFDAEAETLGADEAVRLLHSRIALLIHRKGEGREA